MMIMDCLLLTHETPSAGRRRKKIALELNVMLIAAIMLSLARVALASTLAQQVVAGEYRNSIVILFIDSIHSYTSIYIHLTIILYDLNTL